MDLRATLKGGTYPVTLEPMKNDPNPPPVHPKVMICIPSGRTWEARCATAVSGLCAYSAMNGVSLGVVGLEGSVISRQRNDLVRMAREHGMDYILQIDSDMVFPPDALCRLLKHNKDVIGATYSKRVKPYDTLGRLHGEPPTDPNKDPLCKAIFLPGGFMLIKLSVFDKLTMPYYYESYAWDGETGFDSFANYLRSNYTDRPPEEAIEELRDTKFAKWANEIWPKEREFCGGSYVSEDVNFFRQLAKAKIESWCDIQLTFQMIHLGTLEVTCLRPEDKSLIVPAVM